MFHLAYLIPLSAGTLFSLIILLSRKSFYDLAVNSVRMLDGIISDEADELIKQQELISRLTPLLKSLFIFLIICGIAFSIALSPTLWIDIFNDSQSLYWIYFSIGTILPFVATKLLKRSNKGDYNEIQKLLHHLCLDNYFISNFLLNFELRRFKKEISEKNKKFVVITGLARSGTTALTKLLFTSKQFHSLKYYNVPFLMNPKSFNSGKKSKEKERAHGDNVMFSQDSVEALEEYFFKAEMHDKFIAGDFLLPHTISEEINDKYLQYQNLLRDRKNTTYLTKNNNFILRYLPIRRLNDEFICFIIFRDPIEHAFSLLSQHKKFCKLQDEDSFVLDYMTWLGHHEFGLGFKPFLFDDKLTWDSNDLLDINFWIKNWINYYKEVLHIPRHHHTHILSYEEFLESPKTTLQKINKYSNIAVDNIVPLTFTKGKTQSLKVTKELEKEAYEIHNQLKKLKL